MPLFVSNYEYSSHVVPVPTILIWVQCAIIILSLTVIGLAAYPLSFNDGVSGDGNVYSGTIAIITVVLVGYSMITSLIKRAYICYHRILQMLFIIVGTLAWAGQFIGQINYVVGPYRCEYDSDHHWICHRVHQVDGKPYRPEMIASAAVGGVIFVLFIIDLIVFSIMFRRHRIARAPATYWTWQRQAKRRTAAPSQVNGYTNGYPNGAPTQGIPLQHYPSNESQTEGVIR